MPTPQNWVGPSICTPADLRRHLRGIPLPPEVSLDDHDPDAQRLCAVASKKAVAYCQRIFELREYEAEKYDGNGSRNTTIQLRNYPVHQVSKIKIYSRFHTQQRELTQDGIEFHVENDLGIIEIIPSHIDWLFAYQTTEFDSMFASMGVPKGNWNVEITYRAGFEEYPIDLVDAVAMLAAVELLDELGAAKSEGVSGFSADGVSVSFGSGPYAARKEFLTQRYTTGLDYYKRRLTGSF